MSENNERKLQVQNIKQNLERLLNAEHLSEDQKAHILSVATRMTADQNEE